jgi:hypothetical protein
MKYKIFDIDYLQNSEFNEDDLHWLLDTSSFTLSLIIGMFKKYDKSDISDDKIISIIHNDNNWMYKHFWLKKDREEYLEILSKIYYNLYRYQEYLCKMYAEMWLVQYGFTSASQKKKKMLTFYN